MKPARISLVLVLTLVSITIASSAQAANSNDAVVQSSTPQSGAPADAVFARPGRMVDAGGFRLNLYCMGSGSPTVVFDCGRLGAWSKVLAISLCLCLLAGCSR
jgi:hypothetical protein